MGLITVIMRWGSFRAFPSFSSSGRMLPMGRILAGRAVGASPVKRYRRWSVILCSLSLGGRWGRKHSPASADVGNCLALLSLSVQGYALHGPLDLVSLATAGTQELSVGAVKLLTSAGCWQSSRPGGGQIAGLFQSQRTSRRHCFGTEVSPMVNRSFPFRPGRTEVPRKP